MNNGLSQRRLGCWQRWLLRLAIVTALLAGAVVYYLSTNRHVVIPGQVYRSAQLNPSRMATYVTDNGIRSVINLRGSNPGMPWYGKELAVAHDLGLHHYDIRLSKRSMPTASQLAYLVQVLETAPKPLLIHCCSGSDRTGFVAAVALLLHNASLAQAQQQISWKYLSALSGTIGPMTLAHYQAWLKQQHEVSSTTHFTAWVQRVAQRGHYDTVS